MSGFLDGMKSRRKAAPDGTIAGPIVDTAASDIRFQALDQLPSNIAIADASTLEILYLNQQAKRTLDRLRDLISAEDGRITGQSLSVLYPDIGKHGDNLLDASKLPISDRAQVGEEWLGLRLSGVLDDDGQVEALLMTWAMITKTVQHTTEFEVSIKRIIDAVADSAGFLQRTALGVKDEAMKARDESSEASGSAQDAHANAQSAAVAAEQLTTSIRSMSEQFHTSTKLVAAAVNQGEKTQMVVSKLTEATGKIDAVVKLINEIAGQTNLLALNAMIEAARAGDAGRGFAVVAAEVKDLANQTAQATEDIQTQVDAILRATEETVGAIGEISSRIGEIDQIATSIAAAVEQQSAATAEIARSVSYSSDNMRNVSESLEAANASMTSTSMSA
ncbi:MAG: methyl-accepting chemotaxis protein, partial [Pseudomonadota bacterium]